MLNRKTQAKQRKFSRSKKPKSMNDHGGSLAIKKRRAKRPLNINQSHHITMKSHHAVGSRSLFKHKKMILRIIKKNSLRFQIKVYEYAIQGNHIHLLVKAKSREGLQNYFRVVAGHVAQRILKDFPLRQFTSKTTGGAPETTSGCEKNQRKFWSYLLYSRIVSWGKDFKNVVSYIQKNTLELLQVIAYVPRTEIPIATKPAGGATSSWSNNSVHINKDREG